MRVAEIGCGTMAEAEAWVLDQLVSVPGLSEVAS